LNKGKRLALLYFHQSSIFYSKWTRIKGGSGFGELGLRMTPKNDICQNLLLDFNITGNIGERKGVMGTLKLKYEF